MWVCLKMGYTGYFIGISGIMMTDQSISGHDFQTKPHGKIDRPWNCHRWVPGRHQPGVSRSRLWTFLPTWEQRWRRTPSRLHCPRHKCSIGSSFLPMVNPKKWRFPKIGVPRVPPNHPCLSDFPSYISHFGVPPFMETPKWLSFQGLLDSISAGYLSAGVKSLNGDLKIGCIQGLKWQFHARSDILFREKVHSRWFYKLDAEVWLRALVGLQVELA